MWSCLLWGGKDDVSLGVHKKAGNIYTETWYRVINWVKEAFFEINVINKSIIYDGSLYYKSKHLPPRYDKRSYFEINVKL